MTIIYRANDGKDFETKEACIAYENELRNRTFFETLEDLDQIIITDDKGNVLTYDIASDEGYNSAAAIICRTKSSVLTLHRIANYGGWYGYKDVKEPGAWVWNGVHFVPVEEMRNER